VKSLRIADALPGMFGRRFIHFVLFAAILIVIAGGAALRPSVEAQASPIVQENAQTGSPSSEWDVEGAGDPSIQGFATDISVNTGDTVFFKVKTDSINYRIDVYRLGYYGGAGARLVAGNLMPSAALPQNQPDCPVDGTTGLADCGNWSVSASWSSAGAMSGIYLAKLKRLDIAGESHIVFIVRDDARPADLVFQTSDTTWQAYNRYGGGSLYCNGPQSNAGTMYACAGRATKVSYNRPFDTRAHDATSFLFNAEYPMVRWLEANGYDVKYTSGVDTERRAFALIGAQKPKVFLSVGHDEYWSAGQRASVEAARNAGVSLAFFSGNEMYWKTRFEPSVDGTNTEYRTLVGYKDTLGGGVKLDPLANVTTATWRDTRFAPPTADGGRPETALTGQLWTVNAGTSAISVPASMAKLRIWKNTRVENITSGSVTLAPDTLGYEWDEALDNGFRPQGLISLSSTTVNGVEKILDFGATVGTGTATHNLTLYKHPSGALVFGAGTVQWSWGLDSNHDRGANPPDQAMQQVTVNLFADMGAQPALLQIGADPLKPLVAVAASADRSAPSASIVSPAPGSNFTSGSRVNITGTATDDGGGVVAGVEVSVDGGATWRAAAQGTSSWTFEWAAGAIGQTTIQVRAIDDSGNLQNPAASIAVTVVSGECPCASLWRPSTVPAVPDVNDSSPVNLGLKFFSDVSGYVKGVRFYKGAGNLGPHVGSLWTSTGTLLANATFTNESPSGWQEVLFDLAVPIAANTTYVVSYHTNFGHYSATAGYFNTTGADAWPLHAQPTAAAGGNGVFVYGAAGFPTQPFNGTNYWVDVVLGDAVDTTAPQIANVLATPIDSAIAVVTWTTDEQATSAVDYSTDSAFPAALTQTASDGVYVTAHSIRLTGLVTNTSYFFRVRSTDRAGNQAMKPSVDLPPQSFTMPSPTLHDTLTGDFAAGALSGAYIAEDGDGEVTLAPQGGTEFSGSALPADWSTSTWSSNGSAVVGGGKLTVDGARVAQEGALVGAGHSLEFVATFSGDPFQHSGYGQTLQSGGEPFAFFSTSWTDSQGVEQSGGSLGVRTTNGSGPEARTNLGPQYLNAPHRFRIDWLPSEVVYYIDGARVAAHTVTIAGTMRPIAASDFNAFSGTIVLDWVRSSPYTTAGSFISRVFDASVEVDWQSIQWDAATPDGTSLAIAVRTGGTPIPDGSWSSFIPVSAAGALTLRSRYIQYRADLASNDPSRTPSLADIVIAGHVPVAPPPTPVTISIGDIMLAEGNSGTTMFAFPVTLSAATDHAVTVGFSTLDGTATAPNGDYEAVAGEVTIPQGATGDLIKVNVSGDAYNEDDETFNVKLTSAVGGTIEKAMGAAVIQNDDAVPSLTIANASLPEGNTGVTSSMTFTVTLSATSGKTVTVNFATADGSALAPADYAAKAGTLTFAAGTAMQTIDVAIVGDNIDAPNKTFVVRLSAPGNATIGTAEATGTIVDDDTSTPSTQTFTTAADFTAGTLDAGAYIAETTDGEVILTPSNGTEFSGTKLPGGWKTTALVKKGTAVVGNGSIQLQGSEIASTSQVVGINRWLEFAATLNGAPQQVAGLPLAQFNTRASGTTVSLYARTLNGKVPVETLIPGNWFNASHVFRIEWNSSKVVYSIDGSNVASHSVAFPSNVKMTFVGSDMAKSSGALTIDWIRFGPYAAAGSFISKVFDAGSAASWLTMTWNATTPSGTAVIMSYRTGNTAAPDATWTAFATVPSSGAPLAGISRYVQFRIQESTTVPAQTPALKDVTIAYSR
jgi:N,N-dimethylformamidase beta subunit-like, C-terminal/Domain of unknown function (DUF4082)/Calx-beta domain/Bacterial Ig domain